jgi:hypothetical protein
MSSMRYPLTRRTFVGSLPLLAGMFAAGRAVTATEMSVAHEHDWDWLVGSWDVWHRRLKVRLAGNDDWEEFKGRSAFWRLMGGLGNVDDNVLDIPSGSYRRVSLRAFDAGTGKWAIWWLDGRNPTYIEPPVLGGFNADTGTFMGPDTFNGRPILMRFKWSNTRSARPWWEQAFSADNGASWEVNWRNWFTRTAPEARVQPKLAGAPGDWDFLVGRWKVKHRRLRQRLVRSTAWDEFDGTLENWPVLGGFGNVGDNVMPMPSGTVRGVGLRAFDPKARDWLSWWLDGRTPAVIATPLRGSFRDGVGTFLGEETVEGRPIMTRVLWSQITPRSARWEQAASVDGGKTWETNWISEFMRA